MIWAWHGGEERCKQILMGQPDEKGLFGILKPRWEGNIKMDLQNVG